MDFDVFGRNVTDKVGYQKTLYYATSGNLCFSTTWQNGETRKSHFHSVGLCERKSATDTVTDLVNTEHVGNRQQDVMLPS